MTILIPPDGSAITLLTPRHPADHPQFAAVIPPNARTVKAGRIEPARSFPRVLFRAARRIFGDRGAVGDWTRSWRPAFTGGWVCTILIGPLTGASKRFLTRDEALRWELRILEQFGPRGLPPAA